MNLLAFGLVILCIGLRLPQNVDGISIQPKATIDAFKNFFTNAWENLRQNVQRAYGSIYDSRSNEVKSSPNETKNRWTLYNKLKEKPDRFLDIRDMRVAKEDLKPRGMNAMSDDLKILLYDHGYLNADERNGSYTLHFQGNSEFELYADLVNVAQLAEKDVGKAISKIRSTFRRMPPQVDDFKLFMLALETVLERIPHLFAEWELAAIFGTLHASGLNVTLGSDPVDTRIIYCDRLPHSTFMRMVVNFDDDDAKGAWDDHYRDLMLPGLLGKSKNLLGVIVTMSDHYDLTNPTIGDWYGEFESSEGQILREYRP